MKSPGDDEIKKKSQVALLFFGSGFTNFESVERNKLETIMRNLIKLKAKMDPIWVRVLCELWDHKAFKTEAYQLI